MEFLDITSLGTTYRYATKIEHKFKQKKRDFGSVNLKLGKGAPEPQNKGKIQNGVTQSNTTNTKKDTGKWCEFHNSPTHSTNKCQVKQSLVVELKAPESNACSDPEPEPEKGDDKGKKIIEAYPNSIVATTNLHSEDPEDTEEGERLFHSQIRVKGSPLQFLVDSGSQKDLISAEVVKRLGLPSLAHPQSYTIGWLHLGRYLHVR